MSDQAEDLKRKVQSQAREFPETMGILADVRSAMVNQLFKTPQSAGTERERLYQAVQVLDAMAGKMQAVLTDAKASGEIEKYVKEVAEGGPDSPV